jgi:hypothetical protein
MDTIHFSVVAALDCFCSNGCGLMYNCMTFAASEALLMRLVPGFVYGGSGSFKATVYSWLSNESRDMPFTQYARV